jgi:hypothetical protein
VQTLRKRFTKSLRNYINEALPLRKCSKIARYLYTISLHKRCTNAVQSLRKRFTIATQSLRKQSATAAQMLQDRSLSLYNIAALTLS